MKRKLSIYFYIYCLIQVAFLYLLFPLPVFAQSCETRGAWLNPKAFTAAQRATTLKTLQDAHINTVFLLAPPIGVNSGNGNAPDFSAMLGLLSSANIKTHLWIANAYRRGSANLADFTSSTERLAQKQWVLDLLTTYPQAAGIHLDYIRYLTKAPVDATKIAGVSQTVAEIYNAVKTTFPTKFVTAATLSISQQCVVLDSESLLKDEWVNQVPTWFKTWLAARPIPPYTWHQNRWFNFGWGTGICQRGVPSPMANGQDNVSWLINGKIDNIISMEYSSGSNHVSWWQDEYRILTDMLTFNNVINPKDKSYMGIGWYQSDSYTTDNLSAIVNKIKGSRADGLKGVVIFQIGGFDSATGTYVDDTPLVNALTINSSINGDSAPFANQVDSCLSSSISTPTPSPTPGIVGDINHDGVVNIQDFILLSNDFNKTGTGLVSDLNNDQVVNIQDFIILSNNFGKT